MQEQGRIYTRPESRYLWIQFEAPDGRTIRKSAKTTDEREARKRLTEEISLAKSVTFKEAVVDFFEVKGRPNVLRPKTISNYRTSLRAVNDTLGSLTLEGITADVLKEYIRQRRKTVSDTSVKRDLAFISSVFSHVIETMPNAPAVNPVIHLPKRGLVEVSRTRWLRPGEYKALMKACSNEAHREIIFTAVHTGMRHSELVGLRQSMINFKRQEITLAASDVKSNRERIVPLCDSLCVMLEALCAKMPGDLVFAYMSPTTREWQPYTNFSNFWEGARTRAGLKDVRFHDLRHTFASWWVQAEGDLLRLRDILGHSSVKMVEKYAHLDTASHHKEIRKVFGHSLRTEENNC